MESAQNGGVVAGALSAAQRRLKEASRRPQREVDDWFAEEPEPQAPDPQPSQLDLGGAGFDELRAFGLSVTQANRFLAYRESAGGFRGPQELDAIPGFPRELVDQLKRAGLRP